MSPNQGRLNDNDESPVILPNCPEPQRKSTPRSPKPIRDNETMLIVGDVASDCIHKTSIEVATKMKVKTARAYTCLKRKDNSYDSRSFQTVINDELDKDNYDVLVIQSGTKDISNLPNSCSDNDIESLKNEVVQSARNLINCAEEASKNNPNLRKIIVAKQIPRYDSFNTNPPGLKTSLSYIFNSALVDLAASSDLKEKLIIGDHTLDCEGAVREARYKNSRTGRYNSVHLFGPSGVKAYTESILKIFKSANLIKNYVPKYYDEVNKMAKSLVSVQSRRVNIPTSNRFSILADYFPGNF